MKIRKTWIAGFIIWVFAMVSIFLAPQIRNSTYTKNQKTLIENQENLTAYAAVFDLLTEEEKFGVLVGKKGILMLDEKADLVGINNESKISEMAMAGRTVCLKLDYKLEPIDAEILKQTTEMKMVERQLPAFKRHLLRLHKAVLLRNDDGQFFMVAGTQEAFEFQKKYGTECKTCGSK